MIGRKEGIDQTATDAQSKNTYDGGPLFAVFARDEYPKWNGGKKGNKKREENLAHGFLFGKQQAIFIIIKGNRGIEGAAN